MIRLLIVIGMYAIATPLRSQVVEWTKYFGPDSSAHAGSIAPAPDGGYLLAGWIPDKKSGPNVVESGYLLRLDADGNRQWEKKIGSFFATRYHYIFHNSEGGYTIVGESTIIDSMTQGLIYDLLIVSIDDDGNVISEKVFGTDKSDRVNAAIRTSDGNFLVVSHSWSLPPDRIGIYKVDRMGTITWQKEYGSATSQQPLSVAERSDGSLLITGQVRDSEIRPNALFLLCLDHDGDSLWMRHYGTETSNVGHYVVPLEDGCLVAATRTPRFKNSAAYVMKVDTNGIEQFTTSDIRQAPWVSFTDGVKEPDGTITLLGETADRHMRDDRLMLISITRHGDVLWSRIISEPTVQMATDLQRVPNGGLIICGDHYSELGVRVFVMKITGQPMRQPEK